WKGWTRVFDVTVNDVQLAGYDGALYAKAPSVQVRLSVRALAEGIAAPIRITVNQPMIRLGKALTTSQTVPVPETHDPLDEPWVSELLREFAAPSNAANSEPGRLSHLRLVELNDATIELPWSERAGMLAVRGLNATISRHEGTLRLNSTAVASIDGAVTDVGLDLHYDAGPERVVGSVKLGGLPFSSITRAAPVIVEKIAWSAPLDAAVAFTLQPPSTLVKVSGTLATKQGTLGLPGLYPAPIALEALTLQAAYDAASETLDISALQVRQGEVSANARISIKDLFGVAKVTFQASTENFPGSQLEHYWPPKLGIDARTWIIENLEGGSVPKATVELAASIDLADPQSLALTRLGGGIEFTDVTAHYFRPLPPVTQINGRAEFDQTKFDVTLDSGRLNDLIFSKSTARFLDLDTGHERAEIEASARGPIRTALEVLDHEKLALAQRIGLGPNTVTGLADSRVRFAFPLAHSLTLNQVDFAASATMEGVGIPDVAFDHALSEGMLTLDLTREGMRVNGTGLLAGASANVTLDEVFTEKSRIRRRKHLTGTFDDAAITDLGLPAFVTLDGPVMVDVEMLNLADGNAEVSAVLDLRDTGMAIPALKWSKPAGAAGRVRFLLDMQADQARSLYSASLLAADLGIDLAADFQPDTGALKRVRINQLVLGDSTMAGVINARPEGFFEATFSGDRLDIRRFIEGEATESSAPTPPISINARFKEIHIGALPPITDTILTLRHDGRLLNDIQLTGHIGDEPITIGYAVADDAKRFEILSEDAGRVLHGFDILDSIEGGRLAVAGITTGQGDSEHTVIDLSVQEFGLINAPLLAQLLNAAFLPGLVDILGGRGIRFESLTAKIDVTKERAEIIDALAFGSSLGISASGGIDRLARTIDMNGMLVPAYGLSRLIDQIPILGRILTGGEKEGLLAAEYLVRGSIDGPTVTVNPLTAFAPGFLRALVKATNLPASQPLTPAHQIPKQDR
ncbi:MAG: AsmA-like C-terminal domain-containing protein, partial [Proteobacteria bacterium]|nr:AsmA-like C-terminal domain-containing protein [Pseudomonadota bacterium]